MKILLLTGPTASGKTAFSLELAKKLDAEIVSADSMQIYRELSIGTAKPNARELSSVRHHLIDVAGVEEEFNAARFREMAAAAIDEICSRGKKVLLVGGTALYIKVLLEGLAEGPPRDEELRRELAASWEEGGQGALWEELCLRDPASAAKLHPNDRTRVIRALEVVRLTGRSQTLLNLEHGFAERPYETLRLGLAVEREELYRRIEERVDRMLALGWVEEVRAVLDAGHPPDLQPLKAIGYRELVRHLTQGSHLDEEVVKIKQSTRNFAKRQLTWMRGMGLTWLNGDEVERGSALAEDFFSA